MAPYDRYFKFINLFVDAVTVRPFFEDLLRLKRSAAMFSQLPNVKRPKHSSTEAA